MASKLLCSLGRSSCRVRGTLEGLPLLGLPGVSGQESLS